MFRAFQIEQSFDPRAPRARGRFVDMDETSLDAGDVLVRVEYSAVGARDAAAALGCGEVRRLPCVGGVDLAGTVVRSGAPRFAPGSRVLATSHALGVAHHGGYAEYALLPGGWVLPLADDMDTREAMAIGSAGLAAAMAVTRMEENGLRPERGPVLVTGASGGVGSLAVDMLAGRGYEVVALTSRAQMRERLLAQGAAQVVLREASAPRSGGLDKARWAGVLDVLGGAWLSSWLAASKPTGVVASVGSVDTRPCELGVLPFVQRGVSLLGIDTVHAGFGVRERAWARLAADLRPRHLARYTQEVEFERLPEALEDVISGRASGRTVVRIAPVRRSTGPEESR